MMGLISYLKWAWKKWTQTPLIWIGPSKKNKSWITYAQQLMAKFVTQFLRKNWKLPDMVLVSLMLFAEDSILFSKASERDANIILNVLQRYSEASGQNINYGKSFIFFSPNKPLRLKDNIATRLGISLVNTYDKFLGLPTSIPYSKRQGQTFDFIKDTIASKCARWKESLLSKGGKEVLIKSITSAIPIYAMSCFRLPSSLCKDINGITSQF